MKNGKEIPPIIERKPDMDVNGDKVSEAVKQQKKREKHLYPLRIDARTTIYVKKEKCNPDYAAKYCEKIKYKVPLKGAASEL